MNEESKKIFAEIKEKAEKDKYLWNLAQENPSVYISPEQEDAIMERMFLVYYVEKLERYEEVLKEIRHFAISQDVLHPYQVLGRINAELGGENSQTEK